MKIKLILAPIWLSLLFYCTYAFSQYSSVNYVSSIDGTITFRVIGEGKNEKALENAERKVFDVLFFRGVPESGEKLALVGTNEIEERARHQEYFDKMYLRKRYKYFVMSVVPVSKSYKELGSRRTAFDIKVNVTALRKDLEQNNIIRKFGY